MNKIWAFLFFCAQLSAIDNFTEAKVGYFIPTDAKFRDIYAQDGVISGLETSFRAWNNFFPWLSASYYEKWGHTHSPRASSHVYFIPLGVGLKYIYPLRQVCTFRHINIYGGLGVLPTYLHLHNHSPNLVPDAGKWGCGGVAKVGVIADRLWNFFIDFFAEYSYTKISFHEERVGLNPAILSYFTIGGGLGYHFGGCSIDRDDD